MTVSFAAAPLWMALLPLAVYLLSLGLIHLRRRPVAMTGSWDFTLLAAGLSGLAIVGPLALLQPAAGGSAWTAVALLLSMILLLAVVVLAARPRLVVYNITLEQLRPIIAEIAAALDPSARWAGETAALPSRGIQLHLDGRGSMRSVSVVAVGTRTSAEGWAEFSRRLRQAVAGLRVRPSPWGAVFACCGAAVLAAAAWLALPSFLSDAATPPAAVAPSVRPAPDSGASHAGPRRFVGT